MAASPPQSHSVLPEKASFPKFCELPQEIQDIIWEYAVFDSSRENAAAGIQFFNTYMLPWWGPGKTLKYLKHHSAVERVLKGPTSFNEGWGFVFPGRVALSFPPLEENDSAYLTNAILWRTSKGARDTVGRYGWHKKTWGLKVSASPVNYDPGLCGEDPDLPDEHPGRDIWYEWDRARDLICIRPIVAPGSPKASLWDLVHYEVHDGGDLSPIECSQRNVNLPIANLALEYDPSWNPGTTDLWGERLWEFAECDALEAIRAWFLQMSQSAEYQKEFYFIDHSLKPRRGLSMRDLGKPAFSGHNGSYYLADLPSGDFGIPPVDDIVLELIWIRRFTTGPIWVSSRDTLLRGMDEHARNLFEFIEFVFRGPPGRPFELYMSGMRIRVLACVK